MGNKKEHPIIFSTAMVQAILSGTKTQTRRIVNGGFNVSEMEFNSYEMYADPRLGTQYYFNDPGKKEMYGMKCPYGERGDHLWVRETFAPVNNGESYLYKEYFIKEPDWVVDWRWKPSIHMPRAAARLFLKITDIMVARLNDITESDAVKEGCLPWLDYDQPTARESFAELWDSINIDRASWESNPFVWVITFEKIPDGTY